MNIKPKSGLPSTYLKPSTSNAKKDRVESQLLSSLISSPTSFASIRGGASLGDKPRDKFGIQSPQGLAQIEIVKSIPTPKQRNSSSQLKDLRIRPQTATLKTKLSSLKTLNVNNVLSTKSSNKGGLMQEEEKTYKDNESLGNKSKSQDPKKWQTMHRLCKKPHIPYSQEKFKQYEAPPVDKSLLTILIDQEQKQKFSHVNSNYTRNELQKESQANTNKSQAKIPIIINSNQKEEKSHLDLNALSVKSTLSLKQNELKIVRHFKIDYNFYQSLRTEDERQKFLIQKMEEDIKEGLKNLNKSLSQKKINYLESQQKIMLDAENKKKPKDTYTWLHLDTKNKELQPKLKQKLMETYSTLTVKSKVIQDSNITSQAEVNEIQKKSSIFNQYSSLILDNNPGEEENIRSMVDSIKFIIPDIPQSPQITDIKSKKVYSYQSIDKLASPTTKVSQISNKVLISGATLSRVLNNTFQQFVSIYKNMHEKQQSQLNHEKSGRFMSNRLASLVTQHQIKKYVQKDQRVGAQSLIDPKSKSPKKLLPIQTQSQIWTHEQEKNYNSYKKQMKKTLSVETNLQLWDQIMMGAFNKVFHDFGPSYQKVEVINNMKKMNFDQVNKFLSTLQTLNDCVDKKDFIREVQTMDEEEFHKIESQLAEKILEEYEIQKQTIKEARYAYLKNKNKEIAEKINQVWVNQEKEKEKEQRKKDNLKFVKRIKAILNGIEKNLIDIKQKKPTIHDDLYKDHKLWAKKVKKPEVLVINPKGQVRVNEAAVNQIVYSYFQNELGVQKPLKFNPDKADEFFQLKYSGGPDILFDPEYYFSNSSNNQDKLTFMKFGALHTAAKTIQKAFRKYKAKKMYKEQLEKEARERQLFKNKANRIRQDELREKQKSRQKEVENIIQRQIEDATRRQSQNIVEDFILKEQDKRRIAKKFYHQAKVGEEDQSAENSFSSQKSSSNSCSPKDSKSDIAITETSNESDTTRTEKSQKNSKLKTSRTADKKSIKSPNFEFKAFSFFIKPQPKMVFMQSGGQEKIFENLTVNQNEKLQFNPTLEPNKKTRFKKNQLTARQENIIKCAKINNVTYILKNKDILTQQDLNARDELSNTALYYAVSNSYYEVTKVLIDLGANINLKNSLGNTCLHKAFMTKNMLIINLLLFKEADLTQINDFQQTPLYFATAQMINELGLSRYVTHFLNYNDFEVNFVEQQEVQKDIDHQEVINKRMAHRIKYT